MKAIVAIGGGTARARDTEMIDREILRLSGKKHPRLLFVPTAGSDSVLNWEQFQERFSRRLGCATDVLYLIREHPSHAEIARKIRAADIVYVGGGNTLMMMRLWRRLGVDKLLKAAYAKGTVMAGVSAGSICWFDAGHSDSLSYYHPNDWKYIKVTGLGLVRGIHCPHYDSQTLGVPRRKHFRDMMAKTGATGIAIENGCAVEFIDGVSYRVIAFKDGAQAYRVVRTYGTVKSRSLPKTAGLRPLDEIYCNLE